MTAALALALTLLVSGAASAEDGDEADADGLADALSGGEAEVTFRYRFELVERDDFDQNAEASTLRTTLSYRTRPWAGFGLFLEAENVVDLGTEERYDNGANGVTDRPVVADAEITEVNQAYLRWDDGTTRLTAGREEFNWADQRYVGAVGWRQNHQTFDAFSAIATSLEKVDFTYLFVSNVNLVSGGNQPMSSHLGSAKIELPLGAVDLYGLYLDYDRVPTQSTSTFGLEWAGSREADGGVKLLWEAEYARQRDAAENPDTVEADYVHLMGGVSPGELLTAKAGWEVLSGSPEDGQFRTPLATLHKWNGWADLFLATPEDGLEDLYLGVEGRWGELGWAAIFHDFRAESASTPYGTEIDAQIDYRLPWGQLLGLKGAFYRADELAVDVSKVWFYTTYRF